MVNSGKLNINKEYSSIEDSKRNNILKENNKFKTTDQDYTKKNINKDNSMKKDKNFNEKPST